MSTTPVFDTTLADHPDVWKASPIFPVPYAAWFNTEWTGIQAVHQAQPIWWQEHLDRLANFKRKTRLWRR